MSNGWICLVKVGDNKPTIFLGLPNWLGKAPHGRDSTESQRFLRDSQHSLVPPPRQTGADKSGLLWMPLGQAHQGAPIFHQIHQGQSCLGLGNEVMPTSGQGYDHPIIGPLSWMFSEWPAQDGKLRPRHSTRTRLGSNSKSRHWNGQSWVTEVLHGSAVYHHGDKIHHDQQLWLPGD